MHAIVFRILRRMLNFAAPPLWYEERRVGELSRLRHALNAFTQ